MPTDTTAELTVQAGHIVLLHVRPVQQRKLGAVAHMLQNSFVSRACRHVRLTCSVASCVVTWSPRPGDLGVGEDLANLCWAVACAKLCSHTVLPAQHFCRLRAVTARLVRVLRESQGQGLHAFTLLLPRHD